MVTLPHCLIFYSDLINFKSVRRMSLKQIGTLIIVTPPPIKRKTKEWLKSDSIFLNMRHIRQIGRYLPPILKLRLCKKMTNIRFGYLPPILGWSQRGEGEDEQQREVSETGEIRNVFLCQRK